MKLIYVKAPGESYSVLFIWTRTGPDELLVEGVDWRSLPASFDFKEKSIPSAYGRTSHYYRRVDAIEKWSPEADGKPVTVHLNQGQLTVACSVVQCRYFEIKSGQRVSARTYGEGRTIAVPLSEQSTIEFPATR